MTRSSGGVKDGGPSSRSYIHGYTPREAQRLYEQALILEDIIHGGVSIATDGPALEAGCGVGAQTAILKRRNPGAELVSIDISLPSLAAACDNVGNGVFLQADISAIPFKPESFSHIFICFVLEHLPDPEAVLRRLMTFLKPGGRLTAIEGDHGACVWSPWTEASQKVWNAVIRTQQDLGHDPLIGRRLCSIVENSGYEVYHSEPCTLYADPANRSLLDGMVNKIIVPMSETSRNAALDKGYLGQEDWERGIKDLAGSYNSPGGAFFYSWFKTEAKKPAW